jgi:hypothetical protein
MLVEMVFLAALASFSKWVSYGGWLALNYALHAPRRCASSHCSTRPTASPA